MNIEQLEKELLALIEATEQENEKARQRAAVAAMEGLIRRAVDKGAKLSTVASLVSRNLGVSLRRAKELLQKYYPDPETVDAAGGAKLPARPTPAAPATVDAPGARSESGLERRRREMEERRAATQATPGHQDGLASGEREGKALVTSPPGDARSLLPPGEPMPPVPTEYEEIEQVTDGQTVRLYRLPSGKLYLTLPGTDPAAPFGRNEVGIPYNLAGVAIQGMVGKGFIGVDM